MENLTISLAVDLEYDLPSINTEQYHMGTATMPVAAVRASRPRSCARSPADHFCGETGNPVFEATVGTFGRNCPIRLSIVSFNKFPILSKSIHRPVIPFNTVFIHEWGKAVQAELARDSSDFFSMVQRLPSDICFSAITT
jgi:hypothetical protein